MSLFGQLVRTAVNMVTLPVAVAKDAVTLGNVGRPEQGTFTKQAIQRLKDEAEDSRARHARGTP